MTMQNPERVVTKQDLKDFYDGIYPYLGGGGGGESIQVLTMPEASQANENKIVEYVGDTTASYTNGYFYVCVGDGQDPETFSWEQKNVQPGGGGGTSDYTDLTNKPQIEGVTLAGNKSASDLGLQNKMQLTSMPTASADYLGDVVQFIGTTNATYTHGYYYECVSDGESSPTYSWAQTNVQPSSGGTVLSQTLLAGETSVTFSSIPTTGNNLIDFFTTTGINYTAIDTSTAGQVTLTYEEQAVAVTVYCEIKGVS